jgi:orotidine-5'-phosphate decarboxylase
MTGPEASLLSTKPIPRRERLIVALDVDTHDAALDLVRTLGDAAWFYKIGLQLFLAANHLDLIKRLRGLGKRVFADLKLFDVPETVAAAVRQLASSGAEFATIHGQDAMLRAACEQDRGALKLLAVTVLTSIDQGDLQSLGFGGVEVEELVLSRARRALELGCDGVISSGLEARRLRGELGERFLVVSPGIRPVQNRPADDQKRVMSVEGAFASGADYIVVGRPIRKAADPRAAALAIQRSIDALPFPGA